MGARDSAEFDHLFGVLQALEDVPLSPEVWAAAARLGHTLRLKGSTFSLPDLLIAQAALSAHAELWHANSHFDSIAKWSNLEVRSLLA